MYWWGVHVPKKSRKIQLKKILVNSTEYIHVSELITTTNGKWISEKGVPRKKATYFINTISLIRDMET